MSDFGAMISIRKRDKQAFTDDEEVFVREKVNEVHESNQLLDFLSRPYSFETGITQYLGDPKFYEMNVLLSDYWGDSEDFKQYKEGDLKDMDVIAGKIEALLGEKYVLAQAFEWW